jgi:hypothetical protein
MALEKNIEPFAKPADQAPPPDSAQIGEQVADKLWQACYPGQTLTCSSQAQVSDAVGKRLDEEITGNPNIDPVAIITSLGVAVSRRKQAMLAPAMQDRGPDVFIQIDQIRESPEFRLADIVATVVSEDLKRRGAQLGATEQLIERMEKRLEKLSDP